MVAVATLGILSVIASPDYIGQPFRAESAGADSLISPIQSIIAAYVDEAGELPTTRN
jgi:Tfp pilus assembly protein PilE